MHLRTNRNIINSGAGVYWRLVRVLDPVPHWAIRVAPYVSSGGFGSSITVRFDLLGTGGHTHSSSSRESGSAGVAGHWKVRLPWTQQAFNSVGSASVLAERAYGLGAIDATNDPTGATAATLYLTTGAGAGTVLGTQLFGSELPMVFVLAHQLSGAANLVATAAENTWIPESHGCMWSNNNYSNETSELNSFDTTVEYDLAFAQPMVLVRNCSDSGGGPDATLDRTYFVYAIGKQA
jgi:hypothetical protein